MSLSDEAKAKVTSLQFIQNEISVMKARIAVYKTAEAITLDHYKKISLIQNKR